MGKWVELRSYSGYDVKLVGEGGLRPLAYRHKRRRRYVTCYRAKFKLRLKIVTNYVKFIVPRHSSY